ncbi:hypothetical protein BDN70DRAFT_921319 [Pholiota conissans]|uniref:Uncharacterized protein n=1 Tax=Pholiota conissans TaxID=109636 RepID=A0A9P6D0G4_9AGAR|nr:hypothetical protein BDN70DRAFT_921319 [Pholiota conissans]
MQNYFTVPAFFGSKATTAQQQTSVPRSLEATTNALYQGALYGVNAVAQWCAHTQPAWHSSSPQAAIDACTHVLNDDMNTDSNPISGRTINQLIENINIGYTSTSPSNAYNPPFSTPASNASFEIASPTPSSSVSSYCSCAASSGSDGSSVDAYLRGNLASEDQRPIPVVVDLESEFGIALASLDIFGQTLGISPLLRDHVEAAHAGQQQALEVGAEPNARLLSQSIVGTASCKSLRRSAIANSAPFPQPPSSSAHIPLPSMHSSPIDDESRARANSVSAVEHGHTSSTSMSPSIPIARYPHLDRYPEQTTGQATTAYRDRIELIAREQEKHRPIRRYTILERGFSSPAAAVEQHLPSATRNETCSNDGQSCTVQRIRRWVPQYPSPPSNYESSGSSSSSSPSCSCDASSATPYTSPADSPMSEPSGPASSLYISSSSSLGDAYFPVPSHYPKPAQYAHTYRRKDGRLGNPRGTLIVNESRLGPLSRDIHQSAEQRYKNKKRKPSDELKNKNIKKRRGN